MNAGTPRSTWAPRFPGLALALAFTFTLLGGCQMVVNLDELNNGQCKAGQKRCENRCVSLTDPATGCADPNSCAPCVLPHASAHCELGVCQIAACNGDYEDCDPGPDQPGCETDLAHDPKHCGACDAPECMTMHGVAGCSARKCATGGCNDGWDDCNKDPLDGCERPVGTDTDCAGCDLPCAAGMSCAQRMCI